QFEEIITSHPGHWKEREAFFDQINQALLDDPNLWIVLTLREDYVAALDPYAERCFNRLRARFYMERMKVEAALEAIQRPAEKAGRAFGPGVARQLADNLRQVRVPGQQETVSGQYVEPVQLQVVCYQMWERLAGDDEGRKMKDEGRLITSDDLARAGDVNQALTQFYEDTLAFALGEAAAAGLSERRLREWFDEELITPAGTRGLVRQGEAKTGSLPNGVVSIFQRRFLVRDEARGGETWIELVHDRFVEPIRASNAGWFPQHLSALQRQAKLWDEQGRQDGRLLTGKALAEAEAWAAAHEAELEPEERDFLAACRRGREREEKERRQSRRIQVLAGVAAGVAVIALAAAIWGWRSSLEASKQKATAIEQTAKVKEQKAIAVEERQRAEAQTRRAQAGELAARAITTLSTNPENPDVPLLLARQAVTTTYDVDGYVTAQARDALVKAMAAVPPWKPAVFDADRLLYQAQFTPDGDRLVLSGKDSVVRLWDITSNKEIGHFETDSSDLPISQNGHVIADYNYENNTTSYWKTADFTKIGELPIKSSFFDISDDMEKVADISLFSSPNRMTLWKLKQAELVKEISAEPYALEFSRDSQRLWVLGEDNRLLLLDANTGAEMPVEAEGAKWDWFEIHGDTAAASYSNDDRQDLGDARTGKAIHPFGRGATIDDVTFSPNDEQLAVVSGDGKAQVLSTEKGKKLYSIADAGVETVQYSNTGNLLGVKIKDDGWRVVAAGDGHEVARLDKATTIWFDQRDERVGFTAADGRLQILELAKTQPVPVGGISDSVVDVQFSKDGERIAILTEDDRIQVRDASTLAELYAAVLKKRAAWVRFSPDGRYLTAYDAIDSQLWDVDRQRQLFPNLDLNQVTFSRDGKYAILDTQNGATVWETTSYRQQLPPGAEGAFSYVEIVSKGDRILSQGDYESGKYSRLWDSESGVEIPWGEGFTGLATAADGSFAIGVNSDGDYSLRDLSSGKERFKLGRRAENSFGEAMISDDDHLAVVGGEDTRYHLWDIEKQAERFAVGKEGARCPLFSPDGQAIATVSQDGELSFWSTAVADQQALPPIQDRASTDNCYENAFSNDSSMFVAESESSQDIALRVWNLKTGKEVLAANAPFRSVDFSPDSAFILTLDMKGNYQLWNARTGEEVFTDITANAPDLYPDLYLDFVRSPTGTLVRRYSDGQNPIWEVQTGKEIVLTKNGTFILFGPDAGLAVAFSKEEAPQVWNLAERKLLFSLPEGVDEGNAVFSPKGDLLAAADTDKGVGFIFDTATGRQISSIPVNADQGVAEFSADGRLLLLKDDRGMEVFDLEKEKNLWRFDTDAYEIAFSPDGRFLLFNDSEIRPATPDVLLELAAPLIQRQPAALTEEERQRFGLE
ncbi:MAG: WD40 repeat domain-containing protein, partial [Caldilineales bacterium]|nr:WD40 repeat domain-containing protein [Caldilineales bacterium]